MSELSRDYRAAAGAQPVVSTFNENRKENKFGYYI